MIHLDWRLLAALLIIFLCTLAWLVRKWGAWRRSLAARRRGARAVQGEVDAEDLLEEEGFEILERQLRRTWTIECDGEEAAFELRADLLVSRDGESFIAEVKTGSSAPQLCNAATRRQLLEYSVAFASPTILLVDVEGGRIQQVCFPSGDGEPPRPETTKATPAPMEHLGQLLSREAPG